MGLLLTAEERERFAEWLEREATSDLAIAKALMGLPTGPELGKKLAERNEIHAKACLLIASQLRRTEDG